jgi:hypothetical protein
MSFLRRGRLDLQGWPRIADRGEPAWYRLRVDEKQAVAAGMAPAISRARLTSSIPPFVNNFGETTDDLWEWEVE